ncbi:MAG: hypothetical protein LBD10_14795 [Desulfobulbus sp.]|jgi:hypothetical protein|uniref:hypothetical protein n=1 Tax=Desulfobulbus sp. TaxID=895 RepID=UPI00284313C9|nr:hypothetical protein [Desulfobulbus sp.]MDR2551456.1 hypothetical protein [Desulfobulbus sp.]
MLHLALLKLGFDCATAAAMPEEVAMAYLAAHRELNKPTDPKKKRYKVLRKKDNG